jgi:hypothetical protein
VTAIPWSTVIAALGTSQSIELEEYSGPGPRGDVFAAAVTVEQVAVRDQRRKVRSANGDLKSSTRTVYCPPGTGGVPGSRVTFDGVSTRVVTRTYHTGGGAPTPDHVELALE